MVRILASFCDTYFFLHILQSTIISIVKIVGHHDHSVYKFSKYVTTIIKAKVPQLVCTQCELNGVNIVVFLTLRGNFTVTCSYFHPFPFVSIISLSYLILSINIINSG